jgi:hypothetical protein
MAGGSWAGLADRSCPAMVVCVSRAPCARRLPRYPVCASGVPPVARVRHPRPLRGSGHMGALHVLSTRRIDEQRRAGNAAAGIRNLMNLTGGDRRPIPPVWPRSTIPVSRTAHLFASNQPLKTPMESAPAAPRLRAGGTGLTPAAAGPPHPPGNDPMVPPVSFRVLSGAPSYPGAARSSLAARLPALVCPERAS